MIQQSRNKQGPLKGTRESDAYLKLYVTKILVKLREMVENLATYSALHELHQSNFPTVWLVARYSTRLGQGLKTNFFCLLRKTLKLTTVLLLTCYVKSIDRWNARGVSNENIAKHSVTTTQANYTGL